MSKTAIIIAGGKGSRLKPLSTDMPKCLTEVGGIPILGRQLVALKKAGFEKVVIVVGHLGKKVIEYAKNWTGGIHNIEFINDTDLLGTAHALWLARDYLIDGALVIEGDVVFDELPWTFMGKAINLLWFGKLAKHNDDGCIFEVNEKLQVVNAKIYNKPLQNPRHLDLWKSAGIHWCPPHYWREIKDNLYQAHKENLNTYKDEVFASLINTIPSDLYSFSSWHEIDTYQDVLEAEKKLTPTKNVVVILDGMDDEAQLELRGKTPLDYAKMPNLDKLIEQGDSFKVKTMYPNLPLGSVVAMIGLLGYRPHRYYPFGRASFEAVAHGVNIEPGQTAMRCNVVQVENDVIVGNEPEGIGQGVADKIIRNYEQDKLRFIKGQGYRNLLIVDDDLTGYDFKEPHCYFGQTIDKLYSGCSLIDKLMIDSLDYFDECLMLVLWSPSTKPHLPSFTKRWGMDGAVVTAMDFLAGIGKCARMEVHQVGTGDTDTDLSAKVEALKQALWFNDIVFLHVNALDELSHRKDLLGKVAYLELLDEQVIRPIVEHLESGYSDKFRLLVMADHATSSKTGLHLDGDVNCILYGKPCGLGQGKSIQSFELMEYLREDEYGNNSSK